MANEGNYAHMFGTVVAKLDAGRILLGFWQLYEHGFQWHPAARVDEPWLLRPGSLFAFGGLLLGHYFAWCWGLRAKYRRMLARA